MEGYQKCESCSCFYRNLEKHGINISSECSHEKDCRRSADCRCYDRDRNYYDTRGRNLTIFNLFNQGTSKAELARQYGMSASRVTQIIQKVTFSIEMEKARTAIKQEMDKYKRA